MLNIARKIHANNYWFAFWVTCIVMNVAFMAMTPKPNYAAIIGLLIASWMLSLNDTVIGMVPEKYREPIQQTLRALLGLAVGLSILDFVGFV